MKKANTVEKNMKKLIPTVENKVSGYSLTVS